MKYLLIFSGVALILAFQNCAPNNFETFASSDMPTLSKSRASASEGGVDSVLTDNYIRELMGNAPQSGTVSTTVISPTQPAVGVPSSITQDVFVGTYQGGKKIYLVMITSQSGPKRYELKIEQDVGRFVSQAWNEYSDQRFGPIYERIKAADLKRMRERGISPDAGYLRVLEESWRGQAMADVVAQGPIPFLNSLGYTLDGSNGQNYLATVSSQTKGVWYLVAQDFSCSGTPPQPAASMESDCELGTQKVVQYGGYANDLIPEQKACIARGAQAFVTFLKYQCVLL